MDDAKGIRRRKVNNWNQDANDNQTSNGGQKARSEELGGFAVDPISKLRRAIIFLTVVSIMVSSSLLLVDVFIESKIDPESFSLPPTPEFIGPLSQNQALTYAVKLYEGRLRGPESITMHNGKMYTGTADGKILEIVKDEISVIATLGAPPCGSFEDEPTCGRPLGLRFDKDGYLIIVDAYLGLFRVNVETGKVEQLYSSTQEISGKRPRFLNDLDISVDGTIYISDSSTKWDRRHNRMIVMESQPNGRLLRFDPKTKNMSLITDGLYLANGVQLSPNGEFVLVSETTRCRIRKYYLKGPKAGRLETFADNLPGIPDNIRRSSRGGYWVGFALTRLPGLELRGYDFVSSRPWIRRLMTKLLDQETMFRWLGRPYGLLLELNKNGEIIRSLHDPRGKHISATSEVEDDNGILYIGSYFSPFIGRLDIKSII